MGTGLDIFKIDLFSAVTIAAGQSAEITIDLDPYKPTGIFALQLTLTGTGTAKGECLSSINGTDFVEPTGEDDIFSGFTAASGTSGKDIFSFTPKLSKKIKIKITETGGANAVVVSAWLAVQ